MDDLMEELKKIELGLFLVFKEICEKENLRYFLIGGACLGAVRHKGFIPWDDDIDVGMPRPDYDRFLSIAQNQLPEGIFLQTPHTDPNYPNNFAKFRDSNTTFVETTCKNIDMNHGIYIDVFPLDGGGPTHESATKNMHCITFFDWGVASIFNYGTSLTGRCKLFVKRCISFLQGGVKRGIYRREQLYRKYGYEESEWIVNYGGAWKAHEIVPKSYFGIGTEGEFEGIKVMLPENYDVYLTAIYGDYMTPPPKEEQVGHHYCTVIDVEHSYMAYDRRSWHRK